MKQQPKPNDIIIMASGLLMLLFSFFAFFKVGDETLATGWTSESDGFGVFPLFTFAPVFGAILAGGTAARVFGGVKLPDDIVGFTWPLLAKALSAFSVMLTIGIFILGEDAGIGLLVNILGAIGLTVGAFLPESALPAAGPTASGPTTPF